MYLTYCKQKEFRKASKIDSLQGKQSKSSVQTIEEKLDIEKNNQFTRHWLKLIIMMQLCQNCSYIYKIKSKNNI